MKSFFEKLTGAVDIDEFDEDNNDDNEEIIEITQLEKTDEEGRGTIQNEGNWTENEEGELTIDMYQNANEIIIKTIVAGVKPDDLDIAISRDKITIKGKRKESHIIDEDDYFSSELYWGSFSRTISLPDEIDIEEARAEEEHGLLTLTLPKVNKEKQAKLKVKSKN